MECKRCGKCCANKTSTDIWLQSRLTREQIAELVKEREVPTKGRCCMLTTRENKPTCLVHYKFGYEAKPDICKQYICKECHG